MVGDAAKDDGHFGPYLLLDRLAGGGMGEVFLAHRRGLAGFEKLLVIKRILPNLVSDPTFVGMFLNEARLAATLEHPNVVRVYDLGEAGGTYYLAMEYLHGVTLSQLLVKAEAAHGRVPLPHALTVMMGVARGLHYAHEKCGLDGAPLGIVHRDVSPSNVLITFDGAPKILDFGVARALHATSRITDGDAIKGKVSYMSPEQVKGEPLDRRSDVFSIGVLLYELLTGHRLFAGENRFSIMNRVASGEYPPPSTVQPTFDPTLEAIVMRALALNPDDRYPTALALHRDLEDLAAAQNLTLSPVGLSEYLGGLFERPPYPSFSAPAVAPLHDAGGTIAAGRPSGTEPSGAPTPAPYQPPNTTAKWVAAAALGIVVLGAGAWMLTRTRASELPTRAPQPAAAKPAPPVAASQTAPPIAPEATAPSATPPDEKPSAPTSDSDPEAPAPARSPARKKKKQRRRPKRSDSKSERKKDLRGVDGLLPGK